ncbi:myc protein [Biomphalaria pfeifferi]|uniref:Myc protein n=1 Tax=Biomphalaria pfeifferi TaxID=112525 RepID=A0AAD8B9Y2_BIOPF|nr:myc protein [Biomphalaria pfeifferi]
MDTCDLNSLVLSTEKSLHENDYGESDIMEQLQKMFHKVNENSWTLQSDEHDSWGNDSCDEANALYVQASEYDIVMCTDPQPEVDEITLGLTSRKFVDEVDLGSVSEITLDEITLGATSHNFVDEVDLDIISKITLVDTTLNFVDEVDLGGVSEINLYDINLGASSQNIDNEVDLGLVSEINLDDITLGASFQNIVDEENFEGVSEINLPDVSLGASSQDVVDELVWDSVYDTNQEDEQIGAPLQLCEEEMSKFIDDLDIAEVQSVQFEDFTLLDVLSEDEEEAKKEESRKPADQDGDQVLVFYYDSDEEWESENRRNLFDHMDLGFMRESTVKRDQTKKDVFLFDVIELEQELEKPAEESNRVPTDLISWDSESLSEHEFEKIIQCEVFSPCARDGEKRQAEIGSRYGSMAKKQKLDTEVIKKIISIMHDYAMKPPSQTVTPSQEKSSKSDVGENTLSSTSARKTQPESRSTSSQVLSASSELPSLSSSSKSNTSVPQKVSAKPTCTEPAASTSVVHDKKNPESGTAPAAKRGKRGRPRKYPVTEGVNKVPASSSSSLTTMNPSPSTSSDHGATEICPPPKYYTKQYWLNEMERQRRQNIADLYAALKIHVPSIANKDYTPRQQILVKTIDYISELKKLDDRQTDQIQSLKKLNKRLKKLKAEQRNNS